MADWSTCLDYELDDIVCDVFGYQNNHAVSHVSDGYCYDRGYYHNKPSYNMDDFLGKEENNEIQGKYIIQNPTFPRSQDYSQSDGTKVSSTDKGMDEVGVLALDDAETSSNCVDPQRFLVDNDESSLDDLIFQNTAENMCSFSFDIDTEIGNLGFSENQLHGNGNDHWDFKCLQSQDTIQFEDATQTFRTSTNKHDSHEDVDELSWLFSSSQTNSGDSVDACRFGVPTQSSQFDQNVSKDSLEHQDRSTLKCPDKFDSTLIDDSSSDLVYRSFAQWMDIDDADMVVSTIEQPCSYQGKTPRKKSKHSKKFEKVNRLPNKVFAQAYRHDCVSSGDMLDSLPKTSRYNAEKEMGQKLEAELTIDNPNKQLASQTLSANKNLPKEKVPKLENETLEDYRLQDSSKESIVYYNNFTSKTEGFHRASLCSDNTSLSTKFQQLRDSMDQLDNKTKLCLRDGLYRLAESAEKRRCVEFQNTAPVHNRSESNRHSAASMETDTNSLDRTIAHLLFHRDSENPPFNDFMSLDSHAKKRTGLRPTSFGKYPTVVQD